MWSVSQISCRISGSVFQFVMIETLTYFNSMFKDLHQHIIRCTLLQSNYQFLSESDAHHAVLSPGTWICPGSGSSQCGCCLKMTVRRYQTGQHEIEGILKVNARSTLIYHHHIATVLQAFINQPSPIPWHNMIFIWRLPCVYALWFIWQSILFVSNLIYSSVK